MIFWTFVYKLKSIFNGYLAVFQSPVPECCYILIFSLLTTMMSRLLELKFEICGNKDYSVPYRVFNKHMHIYVLVFCAVVPKIHRMRVTYFPPVVS